MNRAQWELQALAKREGWRSVTDELERRARERRIAKLATEWEGEEKRFSDRRN